MGFTPIVISSRKAKRHIETIKSRHAELLQGMEVQKQKRLSLQEQKKNEAQLKLQQNAEAQKLKTEQKLNDRKEIMAHVKELMANNIKMKELEIKK